MSNRKVLIFRNSNEMSGFAIKKWQEISKSAINKKGYFTAALSGGKTPVPFYRKLARSKNSLPWDKTHIFMADERFVPYRNKDSNFRMINNTLFRNLDIPSENIHAIATENITLRESVKSYEKNLSSFFKLKSGDFPSFDLILLGMGEDGHTASLFPGIPAINEKRHLAAPVSSPEISGKDRITLTLPVINNAKNIIFLVTGSNKAGIVRYVIEGKNTSLPAARVKPVKGKVFFLLDKEAGALLTQTFMPTYPCLSFPRRRESRVF